MHARHHVWGSTEAAAHNAVETVQNSYLDAGVQVFINIFVQHLSPWGFKHPLSRALHNVMVVYLLCESHSGYDLPFMSHRLFPGLFGGPVAHEQHHQQGNVNFHQFFLWADRILGHTPTAEQNRKHREALAAVGAAQDSARQQQAAAEVVR
uniref:Fatty acid hydroxylase domain-containing protein n=2 Tax=Emiliania huxleyi TaxID=2903 RepID=A0A7S3SUV7_EMIHU